MKSNEIKAKSRVSLTIIFLLGCLISLRDIQSAQGKTPTQAATPKPVTLKEQLIQYGRDNHVFFTIEEGVEDTHSWKFNRVNPAAGHETVDQLLSRLEHEVPYFTFRYDNDKRIIHVIDGRLSKVDKYSLETIIPRVDFSGTVVDFVSAIAGSGVAISAGGVVFPPEFPDYTTPVRARAANIKVRDLLTDFLPLKGRGPILWITTTKLEKGAISYVYYYGASNEK